MKKIFFLLTFCLSFALSFQAIGQYDGYLNDTISSSSSIDTLYLYFGGSTETGAASAALSKSFGIEGSMNIICHTDSLSGATDATLYVQYANRSVPTLWHTASSTYLNGSATQSINVDDPEFTADKCRLMVITGTVSGAGTQAIRIQSEWTFKRKR